MENADPPLRVYPSDTEEVPGFEPKTARWRVPDDPFDTDDPAWGSGFVEAATNGTLDQFRASLCNQSAPDNGRKMDD